MEIKTIAVILLVLIALGTILTVYYVDINKILKNGDGQEIETQEKLRERFQNNLLAADETYIVMDARNSINSTISDGILQCGIDLAASQGLSYKNLTILAIDETGCFGIGNESLTISDCLNRIKGKVHIYITSQNKTEYFEDRLVVSIDEPYIYKSCDITLKIN